MAPTGRVRIYIDADGAGVEQGVRQAELALKRLGTQTDAQDVKAKKFTQTTDKQTLSMTKLGTSIADTAKLLKTPALIAGAGGAAQALSAMGAGAVGLTSALAPLSGALAAYPALLGAFGQASGVVALAGVSDLTEAVGGLNEKLDESGDAFKKLSPQAQDFAKEMQKAKAPLLDLQKIAQKGLFSGAGDGLSAAMKNFGDLKDVVQDTSDVMGDLLEHAGKFVGREGFGRDFSAIGKTNAGLIGDMGKAGFHFADALRHVMVEAQPLIKWMGQGIVTFSRFTEEQAKAGRKSGDLAGFFDETRDAIERVTSIGGSLVNVFLDIGHAAKPLGDDILKSLDQGANDLERWTGSVDGKNTLAQYFEDAKGPLWEAGKLIRDATGDFLSMGNTPGLEDLLHKLRVDLLPVLDNMVTSTTAAFGPKMVDLLVELGKTFATFAGSSGPLVRFVELMTEGLHFLNKIIDSNAGIKALAVTFVGLAGVVKAVKFAGAITGLNTMVGLYRDLRVAATGAAAAETAAAGASGGSSAASLVGGSSMFGGQARAMEAAGTKGGTRFAGAFASAAKIGLIGGATVAITEAFTTSGGIADTLAGNGATWDDKLAASYNEKGQALSDAFTSGFNKSFDKGINQKSTKALKRSQRLFDDYADQLHAVGLEVPDSMEQMDKKSELALGRLQDKIGDVKGSFGSLRNNTYHNLGQIQKDSETQLAKIESSLGTHTDASRKLVERNMELTVRAIEKAIHQGQVDSDEGFAKIRQLIFKNLKMYGLDDAQASKITSASTAGNNAKHGSDQVSPGLQRGGAARLASGGPALVPGNTLGDSFHTMVPDGSFILNRNAANAFFGLQSGGMAPVVLEPGEIAFPPEMVTASLAAMNSAVPRFAKGGSVSKDQAATSAMLTLAGQFNAASENYLLGGGHGAFLTAPADVDCSGAVSAILHAGGLLDGAPMDTVALAGWGESASGNEPLVVATRPITGSGGHTVMKLPNGKLFGTSPSNPNGGAGYLSGSDPRDYVSGAVLRTMDVAGGMAGTRSLSLKLPTFTATAPYFTPHAAGMNNAAAGIERSVQRRLAAMVPQGTLGGGDTGEMGGPGGTYTASWYGPTPSTMGAAGVDLRGTLSFAELSNVAGSGGPEGYGDYSALGGLPMHTKIGVTYRGKSIEVEKLDVGAGGPGLNGHLRALDLWEDAAKLLPGFQSAGIADVEVSGLPGTAPGSKKKVGAGGKKQRGGFVGQKMSGGGYAKAASFPGGKHTHPTGVGTGAGQPGIYGVPGFLPTDIGAVKTPKLTYEQQMTFFGIGLNYAQDTAGTDDDLAILQAQLAATQGETDRVSAQLASFHVNGADRKAALKATAGLQHKLAKNGLTNKEKKQLDAARKAAAQDSAAGRKGDLLDSLSSLTSELSSTKDSIDSLNEESNQDLVDALTSLSDQIKEQNEIASRESTVQSSQLVKALADILSGEIGGRVTSAGMTAGYGSVVSA